jgi:hypothetical protein
LRVDGIVDHADAGVTGETFSGLREELKAAGGKGSDGLVAFLEQQATALISSHGFNECPLPAFPGLAVSGCPHQT